MAEIDSSGTGGAQADRAEAAKAAALAREQLRARRKALPKFRNIGMADITPGVGYRLALPGIVSILHRLSGVLMFLVGIPFVLYLLQNSITSELSFQTYKSVVGSWIGKLVLLVLLWSFFHHLVAGIRFLLLDLHVGMERQQAANSARLVLAVSILLTVIAAVPLFGLV